MQIKFSGTGGAFDFSKRTVSAVVTCNEKNILIDCGFSTLPALAAHEIINDIDYVLITHLHGDHVGSLPTYLAYVQHKLQKNTPTILVPNSTFEYQIRVLLRATFEEKRGSFAPIESVPGIGYIDTTNQHVEGMTSFAYYFVENNELIYYSGDIGNATTAKTFLDNRTESQITVFHETTPRTDIAGHASYKEVQEQLADYTVYAYHIDKDNMPADCTLQYVEDHPQFILS